MSRGSRTGYITCSCITIILGIGLLFISPIIGIFTLIIMFLGIAIVYVYQTQEPDEPSSPPTLSSLFPDTSPSSSETKKPGVTDPVYAKRVDVELGEPTPEIPPPEPEVIQKPKSEVSSENLQERIGELEKRVQLLKSQLAEGVSDDLDITRLGVDSSTLMREEQDEELSELAIRHLLEALDEKLAKRAISKQLYNQLRNKYLARLEKKERRRENTSKRGTKEPATGD